MTCTAAVLRILALCLLIGPVSATGVWAASTDPPAAATPPAAVSTPNRPSPDQVAQAVRELVNGDHLAEALDLLTPYKEQPAVYPTLYSDYLVILHWVGRDREALQGFEALPPAVPRRIYLLLNMAAAYHRTGRPDRASALYQEVLAADPGNREALQAMAAPTRAEPDKAGARPTAVCPPPPRQSVDLLALPADPGARTAMPDGGLSAEVRAAYVRARAYEQQGRYWDAVGVYDTLLTAAPADPTARRLRVQALARMGATSLAEEQAVRFFPEDDALHEALRRDAAFDRIRWEEPKLAVSALSPNAGSGSTGGRPHGFALMLALARAGRAAEAVTAYEAALTAGQTPPVWARAAAAQACLDAEMPEKALTLYDQILTEQPDLADVRMGRFYTLQTLRRWEEADVWLARMTAETPPTVGVGGVCRPNPALRELAMAEAWYLAYQDRLDEAQAAFTALHEAAPADPGARNGLAHVYLWRGWPRRALETFDILGSWDSTYQPARTGRVMALEQTVQPREARTLAEQLVAARPTDADVRRTQRTLALAQMRAWRTSMAADREEDGAYDARIRTELSTPLSLKSRLEGYLLWRRTWYDGSGDDDDGAAYFRRIGLGLDHLFNADWRARGAFSVNYDDGREPGVALRIDYTPTDTWSLGVFGDTFSTDVDRRARLDNIDAALAGGDVTWRQSEWRQADLGYTRSFFSDDNIRDEFSLGYQQNLWVRHDWRMRIFTDLYATWNSLGDQTVYYNPRHAWSLSLTHMTEQTVWSLYQRSFVHRLFVTIGNASQQGFGSAFTGALRYEQDHVFSDRHSLKAGIGVGRNVYDGEPVNDVRLDMEYQWLF